jgi:hypothetical protein
MGSKRWIAPVTLTRTGSPARLADVRRRDLGHDRHLVTTVADGQVDEYLRAEVLDDSSDPVQGAVAERDRLRPKADDHPIAREPGEPRAESESRNATPPNSTSAPVAHGTRFMAGDPMNPATNRLSGSW